MMLFMTVQVLVLSFQNFGRYFIEKIGPRILFFGLDAALVRSLTP